MSSRHVRNCVIAAPIIGFAMLGCGSSSTTFTGVGGGGNGGTSTGTAGSDQGGSAGAAAGTGSGGSDAGGTSGDGGTSSNGGTGNPGSAGGTADLGYEPVGVGDPWFFSTESDFQAFAVEYTGATGTATWNDAGEVHLPVAFTAQGDKAFIHFTVADTNAPLNLTHRVLRARVRVASGATASGGVEGYSQSTSAWTWMSGGWQDFSDLGEWRDIEFDFDTAAVPGQVVRFGLQVYGNGAGTAELIIDDLRLEPKPQQAQPDGGAPGADAGGEEPPPEGDAGVPDAGGGGLGYEPVGLGDPWFFDAEAEMSAFEFEPGGGASELHAWSNGEIHLTATFAAAADTAVIRFTTPWNGTTNEANLSGRVIRARVKVASGATADGGVQVFTQSGGWNWVSGDWNGFWQLGDYTDVTFPLTNANNAASVQRFGMQLYANGAGTVELVIDNIRIEPAL